MPERSDSGSEDPKHADLFAQGSSAKPAPNPFAHCADVTIVVPDAVEVRLVDASVLSEYEVWSFITSILASAVVGFFVAWLQAAANQRGVYVGNLVVFGVLLIVAAITAISKRRKLNSNTKRLRFRVGEAVEPPA